MKIKHPIPDREIGENEDELLNRLWKDISGGVENNDSDEQGYADLKMRIAGKSKRKRILQLLTVGSVAAMLVVSFMVLRKTEPVASGVYAQLENLSVDVSADKVVLKVDGGVAMTLDSVAYMEQQSGAEMALRTASGRALALAGKRMLKVEVPAGRQFQLTLSDGTKVWLNAGSSFEYPVTFAGNTERRVRLEGEAFFEVQRDTTAPFYVEIGRKETIRVLGTSFNVNAYADASVYTTTLVTGKISYSAAGEQQPIVLLPNQQVNCTAGVPEVCEVDAALYAAWKEGWIWFEEEKLSDLAQRLSRIYGIRIQVADRCKEYAFSGKIRFDRGIDYITKLVTETTDVVCQVEKGVILLE